MTRFALAIAAGISALAFASTAQAADLIIEQPSVGVVSYSGGDWDGVYIGGFAGFAAGDLIMNGSDEDDMSGWLVGAALGANFTVTEGIVAGVVGDIAWADIQANGPASIDWVGSLRGRLGFDAGAFMPYVTGGLAVAGATVEGDSNTHFGWTGGAGVEVAVTDNMSVDLLYRYSDYAEVDYSGDDFGFATHQFTVGLNFAF